jgi:hypothetical protein
MEKGTLKMPALQKERMPVAGDCLAKTGGTFLLLEHARMREAVHVFPFASDA